MINQLRGEVDRLKNEIKANSGSEEDKIQEINDLRRTLDALNCEIERLRS
jgi:hypothetical protein